MTKKPKRYTAFCLTCYSQRLETNGKREAARWCTSHENAYHHACAINEQRPSAETA